MVRKPKTEYYVNNKEFLEALVAYKFRVNRAKDAGDSRPIVPNYVGECFLKIATHLSYKPNFVNYMFREDMICDGIENCLQYIDNFNPESLLTRLLTSLKLSIMLSFVGFKKRSVN